MAANDIGKFHFRLVLLGSNATGKTAILNRFLSKKFETKYKPTVEDLFTRTFDLGSIEIQVDFLDTSGSMQFPAMRRLSITTGSAFLIVYAVDDMSSYEVLKMSMAEIQEIRPDFQEIPIVFAGNKCETPREHYQVPKELVSNYVHYELPRLRAKVIECSCKLGTNIDNIFKAYLSLARVSLSSAVSLHHNRKRGSSSRVPLETDENGSKLSSNDGAGSRRSSSMKESLGVRKSCDASITSPMRNLTISACSTRFRKKSDISGSNLHAIKHYHQQEQQQQQPQQQQQQQPYRPMSVGSSSGNDGETSNGELSPEHDLHEQQFSVEQVAADIAAAERAKPRSRSLIWRRTRKSTRSTGSDNSADCRIT